MIYMRKIKIEKQKKFKATNYSQKNRIGPKLELIQFGLVLVWIIISKEINKFGIDPNRSMPIPEDKNEIDEMQCSYKLGNRRIYFLHILSKYKTNPLQSFKNFFFKVDYSSINVRSNLFSNQLIRVLKKFASIFFYSF